MMVTGLSPDADPITWSTPHRGTELPVGEACRRCLYDHALELQQLLGEHSGAEVTVELPDEALELVDTA